MRLTIYRQAGNNLVRVPGVNHKAIQYLTEAIILDDTSAHVRRGRGAAYCKEGNFAACKRDYAVAWKLKKDKSTKSLADHLTSRGMSYNEAGQIKEGNADIREAARLYRLIGDERQANLHKLLIRRPK